MLFGVAFYGQQPSSDTQSIRVLEPDAPACEDSRALPKFPKCRIDNCEKKDFDRKDFPVRQDEKGEVSVNVEGETNIVMYECTEGVTPSVVVQYAAAGLRGAGFQIPYTFSEKEGAVTAHKGDTWVLVEAVARYYTLTEIRVLPPDPDMVLDAGALADQIEKTGHVAVYAIQFATGKSDVLPESEQALKAIVELLNDNPEWRLRIESHTDSSGSKMGNLTLSQRRAAAVVSWLAGAGVKRLRLEAQGYGDARPVADYISDAGRARNRRIELVKLP
jgi:outer membrane protein OmpA-like peptidoglycan-associated protein